MNLLYTVLIVVNVLSAFGVITLVLLQHGKGADSGAGFGAGASGSIFGASGSSNFLSRATAIFITIFFSCSIALSYMSVHGQGDASSGILDRIKSSPSMGKKIDDVDMKSTPSVFDPTSKIPR